ncbi:MAG: hypothetical protein AAB680_06015, partial [Pseudomonadota bacterium]
PLPLLPEGMVVAPDIVRACEANHGEIGRIGLRIVCRLPDSQSARRFAIGKSMRSLRKTDKTGSTGPFNPTEAEERSFQLLTSPDLTHMRQ